MRLLIALVALAASLCVSAVAAAEEVPVVHREKVRVGPYALTVGFSDWPARAERSVDITFDPDGGIADKTGTVTVIQPDGQEYFTESLARNPRQRSVWGIDLIALPQAGAWAIELAIDGPLGPGDGRLAPVTLEPRPGPPAAASWLVGVLPLALLLWLGVIAWRRVRPGRTLDARSWA